MPTPTRDEVQVQFEAVHKRLAELGQFGVQRQLIEYHLAFSNYASALEQKVLDLGGKVEVSRTSVGLPPVQEDRAQESAAGSADLTPIRQG